MVGTQALQGFLASSTTTAWLSAVVTVLGAIASVAGLVRYFAVQSRDRDTTRQAGEPVSEWTPVFHRDPDPGERS